MILKNMVRFYCVIIGQHFLLVSRFSSPDAALFNFSGRLCYPFISVNRKFSKATAYGWSKDHSGLAGG